MTTQYMRRRKATVELTDAQAAALMSAADSYLTAASWDESLVAFGSASGVAAAARAVDKLRRAFYRP